MSSLAELLAWKFPNTPGLRTRTNELSGETEIFDWPGPGPAPNAQQIAAWQTQFGNRPTVTDPIQEATTVAELKAALVGRVSPWKSR